MYCNGYLHRIFFKLVASYFAVSDYNNRIKFYANTIYPVCSSNLRGHAKYAEIYQLIFLFPHSYLISVGSGRLNACQALLLSVYWKM